MRRGEADKLTAAQYGVGYKQGNNTLVGYLDYTYNYNSLDELESVKLVLEDYESEINRAYDYDDLHRVSSITTSYGTAFSHLVEYGYRNRYSTYTTTQISNYTSTVNGTSTGYTYTYDSYGNITSITDSAGKVTKYYYDDLQQLIREDNPYLNKTYTYLYDNAGNRLNRVTYDYWTEDLASQTATAVDTHRHHASTGDRLRYYNNNSITYDSIGNPLTYHNGSAYTFTWQNGRQLATATKGSTSVSYKYNDSGIRTSKRVNGIDHIYTVNGSQIVSESWSGAIAVYLYDENGSPIGMQCRTSAMAEGVFVNFFFEKNLFGDIVAVYNDSGVKVISYTYDAWGNHTSIWHDSSGINIYAMYNPFRYRGYYYDTETEFYYLQSRYYDPVTGRFLNADGYINANGDLIGFNMYAYCSNNPVMYTDPTGYEGEECVENINDEKNQLYVLGNPQGGGSGGGGGGGGSGTNPNLPMSIEDTQAQLQSFADQANDAVNGTGPVAGTLKHSFFRDLIKAFNNPFLKSEQSVLPNGDPAYYGQPGSIRFDAALYGSNGKIIAVWDLKTGSAVLTASRIQIMKNALDPSAIVREIR